MFNNSNEVKITLTYKPHRKIQKKKKKKKKSKNNTRPVLLIAIHINTKKIKNKIDKKKSNSTGS